eukprot:TRINITY_DN14334_c0_g1_i2.p1 TRINITY_DN14334_c0_g1~~TRINITY_DN14334_c0_g1_i2.p1  ORF type:complete len:609 (-),score=108.76 TRINITY_DN14334_c0_g1_i2:15-1841(-)
MLRLCRAMLRPPPDSGVPLWQSTEADYTCLEVYGMEAKPFSKAHLLVHSIAPATTSLPLSLVSGLTLGAYHGVPQLGVEFAYAETDPTTLAWIERHDSLIMIEAAFATSVLKDANLDPSILQIRADQTGKTCLSYYLGAGAESFRFGLADTCFSASCNFSWTKGTDCFRESCNNTVFGEEKGFGFGPCLDETNDKLHTRADLYLAFSLLLAILLLTLLLYSARTLENAQQHILREVATQLTGVMPSLRHLQQKGARSIGAVVESNCVSVVMCLEVGVCDKSAFSRSFSYLREGCQGALAHVAFVVTIAMPMHVFFYFATPVLSPFATGYSVITWLLLVHYLTQLLYLIGYYLCRLPFALCGGVLLRAYNGLTYFIMCWSLLLFLVTILWLVGAYSFDAAYVQGVLTFFGSVIAFAFTARSIMNKYVKKLQAELHKTFEWVDATVADAASKASDALWQARRLEVEAREAIEEVQGSLEAAGERFEKDLRAGVEQLENEVVGFARTAATIGKTSADEMVGAAGAAVADAGVAVAGDKVGKFMALGAKLRVILILAAVLLVMVFVFLLVSEWHWRGGSSDSYSASNLVMPLIVMISKFNADKALKKGTDGD